jgi:hypothetical protein
MVTLEKHLTLKLWATYRFDPTLDFVATSQDNFYLTAQELQRLEDHSHYLLTANEILAINALWAKGKIKNLPLSVGRENALSMLGECLAFCLTLIFAKLTEERIAVGQTEKALQEIQFYIDAAAENNSRPVAEAHKEIAHAFAIKVLADTRVDSSYADKISNVASFAEQLLENDRVSHDRARARSLELAYIDPTLPTAWQW